MWDNAFVITGASGRDNQSLNTVLVSAVKSEEHQMYKAALLSNPHWYAAELIGAPKHAQANLPTRARSADAAPTVQA